MKKFLALVLTIALTGTMLVGCTSSEPESSVASDSSNASDVTTSEAAPPTDAVAASDLEGNVLRWNIASEPKTIDPSINNSTDGSSVINNSFEGLYRETAGVLAPAVAESHTEVANEDGTVTYTFKIKENAKWSDGEPVTAEDFVFSWRRAVDPNTASEYSYILAPILNATEITAGDLAKEELAVKAIDPQTLEVILKQPTAFFLDLTAFPTFMPLREDVVGDDIGGTWAIDPNVTISNGPFVLTDYVRGSHLVLSKNVNYWNAEAVDIDHIIGQMIIDGNTILASYRTGSTHISTNLPPAEIPQLIAEGDIQVMPYIGTSFFIFNTTTENVALQDINVRKAMSMAIDRQSIVDNVTRGGQVPATGIVPNGFPDHTGADFRETAGDYYLTTTAQIEEAQKMLADAGYPGGEGFPPTEILYNSNDINKAMAEAIQAMWNQNLGIEVALANQEWAVFQTTRSALQYPGLARHAWIGDYNDPQTFLDMFISGNLQNGGGYASEAYDTAILAGMATAGEERYTNFYEAEKVLMEDAYFMPIYFYTNPVLVDSEAVEGWELSSTGKFWFGDATLIG